MKLEFIQLLTTDSLKLPGLLYTPETPTKSVAIWLHGMGDSGMFYNPGRINALGAALTARDIAFLSFNNRGAHNSKPLSIDGSDEQYPGGTHYELIADCVRDINGAVAFLRERGYERFYLMGHSTGANKICAYDDLATDNPFSAYVLAGPGDDTGLFYSELGDGSFWKALHLAEDLIKAGMPLAIMPEDSGMHPFSAQSTLDILNPDGAYNTFPFYESRNARLGTKPLFKEYAAITKPTLVIYGEQDEFAHTAGTTRDALGIFKSHTNPAVVERCDFALIPGADHGFHGKQPEFAGTVAKWLSEVTS